MAHLLLSSLSVYPKDAEYIFKDKTAVAEQCLLALLELLPPEDLPDRLVILCTEEIAKKTYQKTLEKIKYTLSAKPVPIPDGTSESEIWQIIHSVLAAVPEGSLLTLDITHGFRTFPFLFFTAALFLKVLKNVTIKGIYYGMYDIKEHQKPIIELSAVLNMIEWFYATRMFTETGHADSLTRLLEPFAKIPERVTKQACMPYSKVNGLKNSLQKTAAAYLQGLPVELGIYSRGLSKRLYAPDHIKERVPLYQELFSKIQLFVNPFLVPSEKKTELELNKAELERQTRLIESYLEKCHINLAVGLIREWIVSALLYTRKDQNWLNYKVRKRVEDMISKKANELKSPDSNLHLSKKQRALLEGWIFLRDCRNGLHHHGLNQDNSFVDPVKVDKIRNKWRFIQEYLLSSDMEQLDLFKMDEETERRCLVILSHELLPEQEEELQTKYNVKDILLLPKELQQAWSSIDPLKSPETKKLGNLLEWIKEESKTGDFVLVQGESGATFYIVDYCLASGRIPLYATTKRQVIEKKINGQVLTERVFRAEAIRKYVRYTPFLSH